MKTTIYCLLTLLFFSTTSCEVDLPETDSIAPLYSFQISGDGFNHTFESGDDLTSLRLNLKKGQTYNFSFVGSDAGGLQDLLWNYEDDLVSEVVINIPGGLPDDWYISTRYEHDFDFYPFVDGIRFLGDRADPRSGAAISGTFKFDSYSQDSYPNTFDFIARDYGGQSGDHNMVAGHLSVLISDHTRLVSIE